MRSTGIDIIGDVPWGTHFCQFYQSKRDLIEILLPYFKAGLENREFCMWVASEPLSADEAKEALRSEIPDLDDYVSRGQIEILDHTDWYTAGGTFDAGRVLRGWVEKCDRARARGFEGLRLTGNTFWLERRDWDGFTAYEAAVNEVIGQYPILAMCTYSLARCGAAEIMDVVSNHAFALIKRAGNWQVIEHAERKRIEASLRESESRLRESEEQLRAATLAGEVGVWSWIPGTSQVNVTANWRRLFGVGPDDPITFETWRDALHPDDRERALEELNAATRQGHEFDTEYRVLLPDGSLRWLADRGRASYGKDGLPVRMAGVNVDITGRKRAEEALRQHREWLHITLTSIGDAVLATDTAGKITFLNPVACTLTGWSEAEALGKPAQEVFRTICEETGDRAEDIVGRVLREGRIITLANHTALVARDDTQIPIEDSAAPIRDASGRVDGAVLVFHDVTAKRRAQDALEASEQRVRLKLNSILSPEGDIGDLDLQDIIDVPAIQSLMDDLYQISRIPMAIVDLKGEVLVGVGWQDICTKFHRVNPDTCRHCIESDTELSAGVPAGEFKVYKCKNNMWDVATPITVGGRHAGNLFTGQFFFEDEPLDYELFRSQSKRYGFDEVQYIAALESAPRLSRNAVNVAMGFFTKLAHMLSLLSYSNLKLARSLAETDALTKSLQQSEQRLNRAQEIAHLGSWELDLRDDRLTWSDEVYRIFGLRPQEFGATYDAFLDAVHPEDRAAVDAAYSGSLRDRNDSYEITHRVVRKHSGEIRWVHEKCEHVRDESGTLIRSTGMVQDITERKRAEEALHSLALFPEENPSPVLRMNREGIILFANPSAVTTLRDWQCTPGHAAPEVVRRSVAAALEEGLPRELEIESAGRELYFLISPIKDRDYANVYGRDVTERNRVERAVHETQRLESVGVLAGGIAHDFNNLLTSILGNASLLEMDAPESMLDGFRAIIDSSEKAASLTRQLLAYAGKGQFQISDVDFAQLVHSSAELIRVSIPKSIEIRLDVPRELPSVRGDSSQMHQVVMNLIINAAEAIGSRSDGCVSIVAGVRDVAPPAPGSVATELAPGSYVFISVTDNGCGMDERTKAKIFDPFFTTKFTGRGLGLAAVQGILRSHKGGIIVESTPAVGSTFTVYLPCSSAATAVACPGDNRQVRRALTILVVDDEEPVRVFTHAALQRHGHNVVLAVNGREALETLHSRSDVDLVILDVVMPVMGGAETFSAIRRNWPALAVLVSSGFSREESHRLGMPHDVPVIEKPYTVQGLTAAIAKVLEGTCARRAANTV